MEDVPPSEEDVSPRVPTTVVPTASSAEGTDAPAAASAVCRRTALRRVMTSYGREVVIFLLLLFGAWATLGNGPPKTRQSKPPERFFDDTALVDDAFEGQLGQELLDQSDISVILYYAPWDAASVRSRAAFETVARSLGGQVRFAAVNCWWRLGECRKTYSPSFYPVIVVHIRELGDVVYPLKGLLDSRPLEAFVRYLMAPLVYVTSSDQLDVLVKRHSAVLVGSVNGVTNSAYDSFYALACQAVSRDPWREVAFAVVTCQKTASDLGMTHSLTLFTWNATLGYEEEDKHGFKEILDWTYKNAQRVVHWVWPSGLKSNALSKLIENRSALVVFGQHRGRDYLQLQDLARDYHRCTSNSGALLSGLGCGSNNSLQFVVMDSVSHPEFAPPGVLGRESDTAAVFYSCKEEAQYIFRGPFGTDDLEQMIHKFSQRTLTRQLNSVGADHCPSGLVCELSGTAFQRLMLDTSKDVVVLFYASWCGFCKGVYYYFLSAAKFFTGFPGLLFARIDASKNDLPWEFTMERYPTVILFPARRKADSVLYDEGTLTTLGLVRFVLRHVRHEVAKQLASTLCHSRSCLLRNLRRVQAQARRLPHTSLSRSKVSEARRRARTLERTLLNMLFRSAPS